MFVGFFYSKGVLQSERVESRRSGTGKLLYCTHTASGHSASVLSVCATQNYLFSASQGRQLNTVCIIVVYVKPKVIRVRNS